jgi:hypothetical protein
MAESAFFEWVCDGLEQLTSLDRLQARGTVRLALKTAGLSSDTVQRQELGVVLRKLLPQELTTRGVPDSPALCERLASGLATAEIGDAGAPESAKTVFSRLSG